MCLYNVVALLLLGGKKLEAGAAGEGHKLQKGPREFEHHAHQAVLHLLLIPPLPLHLLLLIIIFLLLLLILILLLKNQKQNFKKPFMN